VYTRLMVDLDSSRGYPLWIPESHSSLPADYHRMGLKMGDIGVVTKARDFDVFFNICSEENHPIHHPDGVPSNFKQVILNDRDLIYRSSIDPKGKILKTQSVTQEMLQGSGGLGGNLAA
ncbi:hypothetical protein BU15DRAFT_57261, partial [Melanogaster broomeanus]